MRLDAIWGGLAGIITTVLGFVVRWVLTRPERQAQAKRAEDKQKLEAAKAEISQKKAIDESVAKLETQLRSELRADNSELRERSRQMEAKLAAAEARLEDLVTSNDTLRRENMELKGQNGAQSNQLETQAAQLKRQAERIGALEAQVSALQADRLTLIDAMRAAGIPIPPLVADKKPGTGPLGQSSKG